VVFGSARRELQQAAEAFFGRGSPHAGGFVDRFGEVYEREHRNRANRYDAPTFVRAWASEPSPDPLIESWRAMCDTALRQGSSLLVLTTFERKFDTKVSAGFPNTFLVKQWRAWLERSVEEGEPEDPKETADSLLAGYGREFGLTI
jgi:hypothetical protein